jgi:hypothetical protein
LPLQRRNLYLRHIQPAGVLGGRMQTEPSIFLCPPLGHYYLSPTLSGASTTKRLQVPLRL